MKTIVLALAVAAAPAMAFACDSPSDPNPTTIALRDGGTTRLIGSVEDMKRITSKLGGHEPALFVRLDGKAYVIEDAATLDRARAIFHRSDPTDAKGEKLDAVQDEASTRMQLDLEKLAREAIRAGKARS